MYNVLSAEIEFSRESLRAHFSPTSLELLPDVLIRTVGNRLPTVLDSPRLGCWNFSLIVVSQHQQ